MTKRCAINMLAIRNEDPDLLRAIVRGRGRRFEIYGAVIREGVVSVTVVVYVASLEPSN
ncbi:hypothetical protein J2X43_003621 [Rhizobium sp. BE258]|nr:hypothetical protein [Rhizobium sp. BE258]